MKPLAMAVMAVLVLPCSVSAQTSDTARYPVVPRTLADSEEIMLARSAAPAEISGAASVYTVRDGKGYRLRAGTNGCACMVSRDLHEGSLYPICFDIEATKSVLGRRVGAWHPHVMLYVPNATPQQLGLLADSRVSVIAVGAPGTRRAEIIIRVPEWAAAP